MLHARLREIRKAKGLTLQQVAERIKPEPTTAQTIGRLETGVRTLTLDWVQRIAEAMDVDPGELLSLPKGGDVVIDGSVAASGAVADRQEGVFAARLIAREPMAVRISENMGQYRAGDVVVCERLERENWHRIAGGDALVADADGRRYLGKVIPGADRDVVTLAPLAPTGSLRMQLRITMAAPAVALFRALAF